jgi:AcrR family transcriptional regulator
VPAVADTLNCMSDQVLGLRERKKAKTRALIVEVADRNFLERGFETVTLEEVAEQCEVSVRTVLRYFDSKEALALSHEYESLQSFKEGLDRRTGDVLGYWRYYIGTVAADVGSRAEWYRTRHRMLHNTPLQMSLIGINRAIQHALARALVEEAGGEGDPLAPELLAAILVAGNESFTTAWLSGRSKFDPAKLLEVVDYASELFEGRLGRAGIARGAAKDAAKRPTRARTGVR